VEGFTSPAFVSLAALCRRLGLDPLGGVTLATAAAALAALWLAARLEQAVVGERPPATPALGERPSATAGLGERPPATAVPLSALLLVGTSAFAYWALRAMDTMLFTALLLAALWLAAREWRERRWRGSGLLFALLALMRPEGLLLFGLATAAFAVAEGLASHRWRHLRRHAANAALFALPVALFLAWRHRYYGELLPNTFYAKVTGGPGELATGIAYLGRFALAFPLLALALVAPLALVRARRRARLAEPALALALQAVALGTVAYVVVVGADFMPFFRFFVPALPLCAVLAATGLRTLPLPARAWNATVAGLVGATVALGLLPEEVYRAFVAHRTALVGKEVGRWLGAELASDDWIAINTAGAVPYVSGLPAIDMLGLTDEQIARRPVYIVTPGWAGHRRGWGEYVLRRRPRAILFYNSAGLAEPHYLSDHELADHPLFRLFYRIRSATLPPVAGARPGDPIRRFLGFPFGFDARGAAELPDLGLRAGFYRLGPLGWTTFSEGPIRLIWFELDGRDVELWEEGLRHERDALALAELAAVHWAWERAGDERAAADPAARAEVAALCEHARLAVERGDLARARSLLGEAARRNGAVRSPLVPHYVANVAVLTGELFTAVDAAKEALRLEPADPLYRSNLARLLAVPYRAFEGKAKRGAARGAHEAPGGASQTPGGP
jgi:hypothetical protein